MNASGLVLVLAGIWLITQIVAGDMMGRLNLL